MENNKYFTPDIEDICIGYELEVHYNFKLNGIFHKKKEKVKGGKVTLLLFTFILFYSLRRCFWKAAMRFEMVS